MQNSLRIAALSSAAAIAMTPAFARAADGEDPTVGEVLVTARKVTERVQDIPIPVTAIGREQLEAAGRVNTMESLSNIAPGVKVFRAANQSNSYAVFIRGLGRDNGFPHVEAPVATYIDDVNYPYQVGPTLNIGGISRVEVLRGPQGTLYGRSATVGAVKYYTERPDLNEQTRGVTVTGGTHNRAEMVLSAGTPLAPDQAGVKADFGYHHTGGYKRDRRTGKHLGGTDGIAGRISLLYRPTDNLEIFVSADGTRDRDSTDPQTATVLAADGRVLPLFGDNFIVETHPTNPQINKLDAGGATGQVTYDWKGVTLKSITAFRQFRQQYSNDFFGRADVAYTGSVVDARVNYWTQEFQATRTALDDRLTYVGGAFYLSSDVEVIQKSPGAANTPTYNTTQNSWSFAAYADATFNFTDQLSVSGGVRYTYDEKDVYQNVISRTVNFNAQNSDNWTSTTPRVTLNYKVTDDILVFAGWAKGYKTGALSSLTPAQLAAAAVFISPEKVDNREVGIKSEWFEKRLRANVTYFKAKYTDQTTAALDARNNNFLISNDVDAEGVEAEVLVRPQAHWFIAANAAWLDAEYVNISPTNTTILNLADKTPKHSPKLTYQFRAGYTFENVLNTQGALSLGVDYNHYSGQWECLAHNPPCRLAKYGTTDVNATYTFPDERLQMIIAGTNVGGAEYFKLAGAAGRLFSPKDDWSFTVRYRY